MKLFRDILLVLILAGFVPEYINAAVPSAVGGTITVRNSVFDNDDKYSQVASTVDLTYSAVKGTTSVSGTGNLLVSGLSAISDQNAAPLDSVSYYLSPASSCMNAASPVIPSFIPDKDINGNVRVYDGGLDIGAVEYSMFFDQGDGMWNESGKWSIGRNPGLYDRVTILNESTVDQPDAVCDGIIGFGNSGKLTVETDAQLEVTNEIANSDAEKIIVKSAQGAVNGTLIFGNAPSEPVAATVQMYSMAYVDENLADDDPGKYKWQYFGIPVRSMKAVPSFDGAWVRGWNEASEEYSKWEALTAADTLHSFSGYELVQLSQKTYNFSGTLENRDTTINLRKSDVPYYAGQHVIANPYTAAINIDDLVFGANTEATVYVYNSGSYADWNAVNNTGRIGSGSGQYIAVPKNASGMVLSSIPSMQGFIVRALSDDGSVTIPYSSVRKNNGMQRVKSQATTGYLTVDLESENYYDKLWLLYEPEASRDFDNGWDGYKFSGSASEALIYAKEPAGDLQVNTVGDFNNINVYFRPGEDSEYTLKVVNHDLEQVYPRLYFVDLFENKVVEIGTDTLKYNFTSDSGNPSLNRFRIMTDPQEDSGNDSGKIRINYFDSSVLIQNLTEETGTCYLYDLSGRLCRQEIIVPGLSTFSVGSFTGIMIVKAVAGDSRSVQKIILSH